METVRVRIFFNDPITKNTHKRELNAHHKRLENECDMSEYIPRKAALASYAGTGST